MLTRVVTRVAAVALIAAVAAGSTAAQTIVPWDPFIDDQSTSVCDIVNADNAELVVLSDTGHLVIVTGADVILEDTEVTLDADVFVAGEPAGFITFAEDGDGFRTLWWVSLTGRVVNVDGFTGLPTETASLPVDFFDVPCDACDFWDDPAVCGCANSLDCDDDNECTDDVCSDGVCQHFNNITLCDDGDSCTDLDVCLIGICAGTPILDCVPSDDDTSPPGPGLRISICGNSVTLTIPLVALGLVVMGFVRRRGT